MMLGWSIGAPLICCIKALQVLCHESESSLSAKYVYKYSYTVKTSNNKPNGERTIVQ